jgi:phenylacetate-CoA ligase
VITTLWNPLVPLIRYRTGDRVTLADRACRCGHAHPALLSVDGRTMDWFVDGSGRRVAPQRLWLSMHAPEALRSTVVRYRLVQASDRRSRVEIVSAVPITPALAARTKASYEAVLGVTVEVLQVPELSAGPGGRFRAFTSAATPTDTPDPRPSS